MSTTYLKSINSDFIVKKDEYVKGRCRITAYHRNCKNDPGKGSNKVVNVLLASVENLERLGWKCFKTEAQKKYGGNTWTHSGGFATIAMVKQ